MAGDRSRYATGITPLMTAAGMGHGSNPSRGRFNTEDDGLAAVRLLLKAGAGARQ